MKQAIFFDLDGTLIDTSGRHYKVYSDILEFYGIPNTLSKKEFWNHKRNGRKTVELLPEGFPEDHIRAFTKEWLKRIEDKVYLNHDVLLAESLDVLSVLNDKADLTLVTLRNNSENLFWELDNFGLINYFSDVVIGSPTQLKNKTALIKDRILTYSKGDNVIIIGDSETDISSGKELGILSVAVTYGIRSKDFLEKLEADFYLDNLSGIVNIVAGAGAEL